MSAGTSPKRTPNKILILFCIVNEGKKTHFLLNFTLNEIKLAQIMNN